MRKMPSRGEAPPPTTLLFTGEGDDNTNWTITGPEVKLIVDWSEASHHHLEVFEALGHTTPFMPISWVGTFILAMSRGKTIALG